MKLTSQIECTCTVRASLSEKGVLTLRVNASSVYDDKSGARTTVDIDVPDREAAAVRDSMMAAMKAVEPELHTRISDAISVSRKVAIDLGEMK